MNPTPTGATMIVVTVCAIMLAIWGVSFLFLHGIGPRRKRPMIIAALEVNERLGVTDLEENVKAVRKRLRLLNLGYKELSRYDLYGYADRIEAQLNLLTPYEETLNRSLVKRLGTIFVS